MEALAALGLACNVMTVIQFGKDVIAVYREIKNQGFTTGIQNLHTKSHAFSSAAEAISAQIGPDPQDDSGNDLKQHAQGPEDQQALSSLDLQLRTVA